MTELHSDLLIMTPAAALNKIRTLIHSEDYIQVTMSRDSCLVQQFWDHHDGEILELEGEEMPDLAAATTSFNLKWIEQERAYERRRLEGAADTACALSILPGLFRNH